MRLIIASSSIALLLAGCASGRVAQEPVPSAQQLVGSYVMGWGGICYEIELRPDRTYTGVDCAGGHFGPADGPNRSFSGLWNLQGEILSFSSVSPTGNPDLGPAEVFFYQGGPAFVELKFVDRGKATPRFLFTRHSRE